MIPLRPACAMTIAALAMSACVSSGTGTSNKPVNDPKLEITVDAGHGLGPLENHQGFLLGVKLGVDQELVNRLKPSAWRLTEGDHYLAATAAGADTMLILSDPYCWAVWGGTPNCRPWEDPEAYKGWLEEALSGLSTTAPDLRWIDPWNEPDVTWPGTGPQFETWWALTVRTIREVRPDLKITGPSYIGFNAIQIGNAIDFFKREGVVPDAINWHELEDNPEELPAHVAAVRGLLFDAGLDGVEVHVGEYGSADAHLIPGWAFAWLYWLTEANPDWASRACWTPPGTPTSDCDQGLDGVLMPDQRTPRAVYHVAAEYARMVGLERLEATSTKERIRALAVRGDDPRTIQIMIGDWETTPQANDVPLTVTGYPWSGQSAILSEYSIPNTPDPLAAPVVVRTEVLPAGGDEIELTLTKVADGEVRIVVVGP